VLFGGMLLF